MSEFHVSLGWGAARLVFVGSGWWRLEGVPVGLAERSAARLRALGASSTVLVSESVVRFRAARGSAVVVRLRSVFG